jgi:transcriptional regulator with XRE-family HTH domain
MSQPHPALAVIKARQLDLAQVAADVGVAPNTLRNVLRGQVNSWPRLRRALAERLDLPESVLFNRPEPART